VAGCCECDDEPSGSSATELVITPLQANVAVPHFYIIELSRHLLWPLAICVLYHLMVCMQWTVTCDHINVRMTCDAMTTDHSSGMT
jgi:hypothetical protein